MNLHSLYTGYVLAAYGVAAILVLVMIWTSWRHWRQVSCDWQQMQQDVSQEESEAS